MKPSHRNAPETCSDSFLLCAGVGCPFSVSNSNGDNRHRRDMVKYRCPVAKCIARYCSVACCKSHKIFAHSAVTVTTADGEDQSNNATTVASPEAVISDIQTEENISVQRPAGSTDGVIILTELQKDRLAHDSKIIQMLGSKRLRQQISLVDHGDNGDGHGDHRTKMLQTLRHSDAEFNSFIERLLETVR
eukprot:gene26754-35436_t